MPISDLIMSGVELMVMGMLAVFAFLTILVFTLRGMSFLASKLQDDSEPAMAATSGAASRAAGAEQEELIAVISAAVTQYRKKLRK